MIRGDFAQAARFIERLDPEERKALGKICADIQATQYTFLDAAAKEMAACYSGCQGLCCRNINLDAVITETDCVYIRVIAPAMGEVIEDCLRRETMFSADCIFLKNGQGPCIFPAASRPKVCLNTFCKDTTPIRREMRLLSSRFGRLSRFVIMCKTRHFFRKIRHCFINTKQ